MDLHLFDEIWRDRLAEEVDRQRRPQQQIRAIGAIDEEPVVRTAPAVDLNADAAPLIVDIGHREHETGVVADLWDALDDVAGDDPARRILSNVNQRRLGLDFDALGHAGGNEREIDCQKLAQPERGGGGRLHHQPARAGRDFIRARRHRREPVASQRVRDAGDLAHQCRSAGRHSGASNDAARRVAHRTFDRAALLLRKGDVRAKE